MTEPATLPTIVRDYLICALWAELDQSDPNTGGHPLDQTKALIDFADEAVAQAKSDCLRFLRKAAPILRFLSQHGVLRSVGHDLWLTRNGHGVGFWDRGYPRYAGDALSRIAQDMGSATPLIGDDGKVYFL